MRRVLFRWRGLTVWSYPAMLYVGLVFGVIAGNIAAHAAGLDSLRAYVATILLIVPALIGARLLFVASEWRYYHRNPHLIWNRSEGGFMMYGAVPVMLLCSVPLLHALHLGLGAFWDAARLVRHSTAQYARHLAEARAYAGARGSLRRRAADRRNGHVAAHTVSGSAVPAHHVELRERAAGAGVGPRTRQFPAPVPRRLRAVRDFRCDVHLGLGVEMAIVAFRLTHRGTETQRKQI
jgi:hypothetical protein